MKHRASFQYRSRAPVAADVGRHIQTDETAVSFPNTNRRAVVAFWVIVLLALLLFGITLARVTELGSGPHPVLLFVHRVLDRDLGLVATILGLGGFAFVGYVVFGAWATTTLFVFFALACFDRDLIKHMFSFGIAGTEYSPEFTKPEVSNLLY